VRYSVLQCGQCVAACCGVLQCVAVCCSWRGWNVVESTVCCSVLQCVAVCCSVLQGAAGCCSVLQGVTGCCCLGVGWKIVTGRPKLIGCLYSKASYKTHRMPQVVSLREEFFIEN